MGEKEERVKTLLDAVGEEGCGVSCDEAEITKDEMGIGAMPLDVEPPSS